MSNHSNLGIGNQHILENWSYANATARTAATGFIAADIGKIAYQENDGSYWRLTAVTPTWQQIGGGSNIQLSIEITAEVSNQIFANIQVQDSSGNDLSALYGFTVWLSDSDTTAAITATAPDTDFSLDTGEILFSYVTDKMLEIVCDNSGLIEINIEETGAATWYLCIKMPDGSITVSEAITFA